MLNCVLGMCYRSTFWGRLGPRGWQLLECQVSQHQIGFFWVPGWLRRLSTWLLVSAQVMISRFVSSSPALGPMLSMRSLLGIPSLPPSLGPSPACTLPLSQNKLKNLKKRMEFFCCFHKSSWMELVLLRFACKHSLLQTVKNLTPTTCHPFNCRVWELWPVFRG